MLSTRVYNFAKGIIIMLLLTSRWQVLLHKKCHCTSNIWWYVISWDVIWTFVIGHVASMSMYFNYLVECHPLSFHLDICHWSSANMSMHFQRSKRSFCSFHFFKILTKFLEFKLKFCLHHFDPNLGMCKTFLFFFWGTILSNLQHWRRKTSGKDFKL